MCTSLKRTVRALSRDDPVTGEALSVDLVTVQLGSGSMAMKSWAAHDAATALREISPLDPRAAARRGELLPEAAERLRLALKAPLPPSSSRAAAAAPSSASAPPPPPSASTPSLAPSPSSIQIPRPWFIIETKIDGYRLQLHKDTTPGTGFGVRFFSPRSYIEHGGSRGYGVLKPLAKRLIRPVRCVLDGELVVYNAATNMIEPVREEGRERKSFGFERERERRALARGGKKANSLFLFFFTPKNPTPPQFGSNYRAIVAANKRNLGDPERPLLGFTGMSYYSDDDDEYDDDDAFANGNGNGEGAAAAPGPSAAAAAAAVPAVTVTGAPHGAGSRSRGRGGGGGNGGGNSDATKEMEWKTTLSAMPASSFAKSGRGVSLQTAEWPAPSCADAQIVYLAFDILSIDGKCVAGKPLSERKELLRRAVVGEDEFLKEKDDEVDPSSQASISALLASDSHDIPKSCTNPGRSGGIRIGQSPGNPMRGRLLAMLPDAPPLRSLGPKPPLCEKAATKAEVERAAKKAEENLEEGIMIKSLASQWIPGAYRNAWVKMKPEYGKVRKRRERLESFFWRSRSKRKKKYASKEKKLTFLFISLLSRPHFPGPRHRRHQPRRPLRQGQARRDPRRVPPGFTLREAAAAAR